ncbi:lytic transglycosylase domain-containing protein [Solimicrobium silvestre]|nr:lytic transglycosylase domain-containing protein [Solimicrobium silvestre]
MPKLNICTKILVSSLTMLIISTSFAALGAELSGDDQRFLALRDAASKEDGARAVTLASQLSSYPLASYVDYYQLKARLRSANESEITDFLTRYNGSAIADRLRNDWLILLGRQSNWAMFDVQYPQFVLNDDTQLKCYALLSKLKQGQNVANDARNLLTSAKVYGEGCYPLFSNLVQSEQFSSADMWAQIRWAAEANSTAVAIQLATLVNLDKTAKALDKTGSKLEAEFSRPLAKTADAHETALILLGRLAKADPDKAVAALAKINRSLTDSERAVAWAQIALPSSQKLLPEAADYWKKGDDAALSLDGYQWRVRTALRNTDWSRVKTGIEAMPPSLLSESAWTYWLGRAYMAENKPALAQPLFQSIVNQTNFYGQLALEESGLQITIPATTPVLPADLAALSSNAGLQQSLQFFGMNLRFEGTREWNWQLRKMSERQLLAAAEFARQNDLLDRMVSTSDRTKTIVDFNQRFPTPHKDVISKTSDELGLDMAWVYGLIRQESRFILAAKSSAGASGLMQVMPGTARYVAKKRKIDNFDATKVNDIDTNIVLGTHYLSIVLANLNGSQVLASAGYNAGPNRSRAWRASLPKTVEGAIFAETIPYPETRDYVKNVLSNATYYAALFQQTPQSLKARLGSISPAPDDLTPSN